MPPLEPDVKAVVAAAVAAVAAAVLALAWDDESTRDEDDLAAGGGAGPSSSLMFNASHWGEAELAFSYGYDGGGAAEAAARREVTRREGEVARRGNCLDVGLRRRACSRCEDRLAGGGRR